jgi:hypothetical protein
MMFMCIQQAFALFKTEPCVALTLVAVGLILGLVVAGLLCSVLCPRRGKCSAAGRPKAVRAEPKFEKRHPAPADGSVEIYVGNLSYDLTEDQLRKEFEAYGKVNSARIITNRYTNRSKGFGFVQMPVRAEAEAAVKALSDKDILGRKLKCNEAKNVG